MTDTDRLCDRCASSRPDVVDELAPDPPQHDLSESEWWQREWGEAS